MKAITRKSIRLLGVITLLLLGAVVYAADSFPGQLPDNARIKTQQKADKLFEKGDYERAMFIYRKELAPVGDKFAQYMVGYMHYSGRGVAEDPVTASAWYRLAGERDEESYVRVRDVLLSLLNDEQRSRSNSIYSELREEMGDIVLIARLINDDLAVLMTRRGSEPFLQEQFERLNFGQKETINKEAVVRLEQRIDYLVGLVAADESASDLEREKVRALEIDVRREIDVFEASIK
jgi:TPR repeat protein